MVQIRNSLLMAVVILCFSSCGPSREQPRPKAKSSETPKIESTLSLTLVPVADGGAYAVDELYGVVWYVSNGKALRVSALKAHEVGSLWS
jgi:hypothetical protein